MRPLDPREFEAKRFLPAAELERHQRVRHSRLRDRAVAQLEASLRLSDRFGRRFVVLLYAAFPAVTKTLVLLCPRGMPALQVLLGGRPRPACSAQAARIGIGQIPVPQ